MKMKKLSTLCIAASTLLATSSVMAWESEDGQHSTSASVAMTSDYVWRGYSNSNDLPAIQGSFDYGHASGFYAGTWGSNVDFGDATVEIDIYAGYANEIGDTGISYDVSALRYIYPGAGESSWNEYTLAFGYSYFSASAAFTSDIYGSDEKATYYSVGFDYDLPMGIALSAGYGLYDFDDADATFSEGAPNSSTDYRIGLSTELVGFGWDLTYTDSDSDGEELNGHDLADNRLIFTVSKSL